MAQQTLNVLISAHKLVWSCLFLQEVLAYCLERSSVYSKLWKECFASSQEFYELDVCTLHGDKPASRHTCSWKFCLSGWKQVQAFGKAFPLSKETKLKAAFSHLESDLVRRSIYSAHFLHLIMRTRHWALQTEERRKGGNCMNLGSGPRCYDSNIISASTTWPCHLHVVPTGARNWERILILTLLVPQLLGHAVSLLWKLMWCQQVPARRWWEWRQPAPWENDVCVWPRRGLLLSSGARSSRCGPTLMTASSVDSHRMPRTNPWVSTAHNSIACMFSFLMTAWSVHSRLTPRINLLVSVFANNLNLWCNAGATTFPSDSHCCQLKQKYYVFCCCFYHWRCHCHLLQVLLFVLSLKLSWFKVLLLLLTLAASVICYRHCFCFYYRPVHDLLQVLLLFLS